MIRTRLLYGLISITLLLTLSLSVSELLSAQPGPLNDQSELLSAQPGPLNDHPELLSAQPGPLKAQPESLSTRESTLRLVFTGDIMGHDTQIAAALAAGETGYDYRPCFRYLEPYLKEADLAIGNLEVTFAGPPYKGYPQFSSPDELADALKEAGFDILVTANNHALDGSQAGLVRTLDELGRRGILHTGTFRDPLERSLNYPLVFEKKGIRIALLNYTYGTNGLNVPPPAVVNSIDALAIQRDLLKAASAEPDFILVTMHWGNEYERTESPQQRELASMLFAHGADAIIGSHPHVVQPIRGNGKGNLVAYSMGNFISNQRNRYRDGGIALEIELKKGPAGAEIAGHGYLPFWVYKPVTKKGIQFTLVPAAIGTGSMDDLGMPLEDRDKMIQFLNDTRENLEGNREVQPYWMELP